MFSKNFTILILVTIVGVGGAFHNTDSSWCSPSHDAQHTNSAPANLYKWNYTDTRGDTTGENPLAQTTNNDFLFGVGYATKNLAASFANIGASQAKPNYKISTWQAIEPDPPVAGAHTYHWNDLDNMVIEYQSNGFSEMHLTLQAKSPWGTERGCILGECKPSLPKPEHWEDYNNYVRAVVERYDGDGINDMPGLLYPVRQYEIETEADDWWPTACPNITDPDTEIPERISTYLQLLDAAQSATRKAYPEVEILPGAMLFYGLFSGEPDPATIAARRAQNQTLDCLVTFNEEILRHPELFDAVEFHFLDDDYHEITVTIRWLREQMQLNGYEKPIYPTDLPTAPALVPSSVFTEEFHFYPQDIAQNYLDIIADNIMEDTPSSEYLDIRTWYAAEQADFAVKLLLSAMEAEAAGVQLATMTDFPWMFCTPTWYTHVYAIWSWGVHGMVDVDWNPFVLCFPFGGFAYEQPRPVFHTLRWFIANLGEFESTERLELAPTEPENIELYAYQVSVKDRFVNVLWTEDGVGQVMEEPKSAATVTLPVTSSTITVTHVITQVGQTEPTVEVIEATGQITLVVSESPIFVEGILPQQAQSRGDVYLPLIPKGSSP
jgi:hypothetical protein